MMANEIDTSWMALFDEEDGFDEPEGDLHADGLERPPMLSADEDRFWSTDATEEWLRRGETRYDDILDDPWKAEVAVPTSYRNVPVPLEAPRNVSLLTHDVLT